MELVKTSPPLDFGIMLYLGILNKNSEFSKSRIKARVSAKVPSHCRVVLYS